MSKVQIYADSTCDLSAELVEKYGVTIVPLYVEMDGASLSDGVEVRPEDVCAYYERTGKLAKTSAVSVGDYIELFSAAEKRGEQVVHFTISSEMSSCYQNACLAAADLNGIYVVDSRNLSTGIALLVIKACEMAQAGMDAADIYAAVTEMTAKAHVSFVIDTLDYMVKGGRCSSVAALGANLLKLKPRIEVHEGTMGVGKKYRGVMSKVLPQYVAEQLTDAENLDLSRIFITHTIGCDEKIIEAVREKILEYAPFEEVIETVAGCTITSHCGPKTLGILYLTK